MKLIALSILILTTAFWSGDLTSILSADIVSETNKAKRYNIWIKAY